MIFAGRLRVGQPARRVIPLIDAIDCEDEEKGEMPYTWINEPPVVEVEDQEKFRKLCWEFMLEVDKWREPQSMGEGDRWRMRIERGYLSAMIASWEPWGPEQPSRGFVYMLLGKPAGLMMIRESQELGVIVIVTLATHPGSRCMRGILIEHAVNMSDKAGYEGRGMLDKNATWNDECENIVPIGNNEWVKLGTEWRLNKYRDRKGFAVPVEDVLTGLTLRQLTIGREIFGKFPLPHRF